MFYFNRLRHSCRHMPSDVSWKANTKDSVPTSSLNGKQGLVLYWGCCSVWGEVSGSVTGVLSRCLSWMEPPCRSLASL